MSNTESPGAAHAHEDLAGEVLDRHLIEKHGWSARMTAQRGAGSTAQVYGYAGDWHRDAHATAHLD